MTGQSTLVEVRLLNEFGVYRAGRRQHPASVASRKARTLLAVLAVEGGCLVTVDRLAEALWHQPPGCPAAAVATLVSRLRASLGSNVIVGGRGAYRLDPAVQVDLHLGADLVATAEGLLANRPGPAYAAGTEALVLLTAETVLPGYPDDRWLRSARTSHARLLRRARSVVARAAVLIGDPAPAIAAALAAVEADPLDEGAYRLLMSAYHAADEPSQALRTYQRLRAVLTQELGIDPAAPTQDLHVAILRHNSAHVPSLPGHGPIPAAGAQGSPTMTRVEHLPRPRATVCR